MRQIPIGIPLSRPVSFCKYLQQRLINKTGITMLHLLSTFSYPSFTTVANVLPSDPYKNESVATGSGLSGTVDAFGTIFVFELAGHFSDAPVAKGTHLFDSLMVIAGLISLGG